MANNQAYLFAGQAAQFVGMGEQLNAEYSEVFDRANVLLGFDLRTVMLQGPEEALKQTQLFGVVEVSRRSSDTIGTCRPFSR